MIFSSPEAGGTEGIGAEETRYALVNQPEACDMTHSAITNNLWRGGGISPGGFLQSERPSGRTELVRMKEEKKSLDREGGEEKEV